MIRFKEKRKILGSVKPKRWANNSVGLEAKISGGTEWGSESSDRNVDFLLLLLRKV